MTDVHLDEAVATGYDENLGEMSEPRIIARTVDVLAELAGNGKALEFAIGTGRIGLPLSERGVPVTGIELSEPMLAQLRKKPGAEKIALVTGDMSSTRVDGEFSLAYLVFNTIMNLTDQTTQVACFQNAADHLASGGHFVIEVMVPRLRALPPGEVFQPFDVSDDHVGFDEYVDFNAQILKSHHITNQSGQFVRMTGRYRWVWPSELDLMARLAGMELVERWGDWTREPFTEASDKHVSVWRKQ